MPIESRANTNFKVLSTDIIEQAKNFVSKEYIITTAPVLPAALIDTSLWGWGQAHITTQSGTRSSPVQNIVGASNWKSISSSATDSVAAVNKAGQLFLWGSNRNGKLGDNTIVDKSSPVQTIAGGTNWKQADTAYSHSVGVKNDGTLWCWGSGANGALGDNTTTNKSSPVQTVANTAPWKRAACGTNFTGGLRQDGSLWLWGLNSSGQLGDGTTASRSSPVQTAAIGNNWRSFSCGDAHVAAIKDDGTLWTWGDNTEGQLGDGTKTNRSSPVQTIAGGNNWKFVSCGSNFTTAIKTDNSLWVWGNNAQGRLGTNNTTGRSSPVQTVAGGNNWLFVNAGSYHTSAIKTDGTLWAWGQASDGKLGDNTTTNKSSPVQIVDQTNNWIRVASAATGTIAIKDETDVDDAFFSMNGQDMDNKFMRKSIIDEGHIWSWGSNTNGALGDNTTTSRSSPVQIINPTRGWKKISASKTTVSTTAAIKDGKLYTWGNNTYGALGDNTVAHKSSPVLIQSSRNWKDVSVGGTFVLALEDTGSLWTWGSNSSGQLGAANASVSSPVQLIAGTNWKKISSGANFAAAIKTDNSLWTWGDNTYGSLGDGTTVNRSSPVQVIGNWKKLDAGPYHTAAIKTDGTLWTWGYGEDGRLGSGLVNRSSPVQIISNGIWREVSCGANHTAAIKSDGTLWLWGDNAKGQLGDGTSTLRSSPVQTSLGGNDWKYVIAGYEHTTAIKQDNTLWTWGDNTTGQLGSGTTSQRSSPVMIIASTTNWKKVVAGYQTTHAIRDSMATAQVFVPVMQEMLIVDTNLSEIQLPGNFNPANNTVEIYGAGGNGGDTGGGGGAYVKSTNVPFSPGSTINLRVATVGIANSYVASASQMVSAESANGQTGGQASNSIGDVKYSGGNGSSGGGAAGSASGDGANGSASKGGNVADGTVGGATGPNGATGASASCTSTMSSVCCPGGNGGTGNPGTSGSSSSSFPAGSGGGKGGNGGAGGVGVTCCYNRTGVSFLGTYAYGFNCKTLYPSYEYNITRNKSGGSQGAGGPGGNGGYYGAGGGARGTGSSYGSQGVGAQGAIRIRWLPTF